MRKKHYNVLLTTKTDPIFCNMKETTMNYYEIHKQMCR